MVDRFCSFCGNRYIGVFTWSSGEQIKMIQIKLTERQAELLSSYLSDCEEHLLEAFEYTDPDGEEFYKILKTIDKARVS